MRPDAPWCTQCYAPVEAAAPVGRGSADPAASSGLPQAAPPACPASRTPASAAVPSAAVWPCSACGTPNALADAHCASCGAGFLAGLRDAEPPLLVLPVVGDLAALPPARRLTVAVLAVLAFLVVAALLGLLLS